MMKERKKNRRVLWGITAGLALASLLFFLAAAGALGAGAVGFVAVAQPVSAITETMTTAMPVNNLLITNPPLHTLGSKPGIQI